MDATRSRAVYDEIAASAEVSQAIIGLAACQRSYIRSGIHSTPINYTLHGTLAESCTRVGRESVQSCSLFRKSGKTDRAACEGKVNRTLTLEHGAAAALCAKIAIGRGRNHPPTGMAFALGYPGTTVRCNALVEARNRSRSLACKKGDTVRTERLRSAAHIQSAGEI